METALLDGAQWLAVLRIGLGLWWLESVRHKNLRAWLQRAAGINWAASVAEEHPLGAVRRVFDAVVRPRPRLMSWVVVLSELALGLGLTFGLLTPVALVGGLLLNATYLVLMVKEVAEQGQNGMMLVMGVVCLGGHAWQTWSLDALIGWF